VDVVLGVDAHKRTHTVVAVDANGRKLGEKTIPTTSVGHDDAVRWARAKFGTKLLWGVEDCRPLTALLERDLLAAGLRVIRVPPHLMSRARTSARERGKSDPIDALAVARAVLREPDLPVAYHDPVSMELRLLVDRREDLVGQRTATIHRLVSRAHQLDPSRGPAGNWQRHKTRDQMRAWLTTQSGLLAELARDEMDDIDRLTVGIEGLAKRIGERVGTAAPSLLELPGCAELTAARIVAEVAGVRRFKSESAFARYVGLAPIPHWSGDPHGRLRATRHGNRQLNMAVHRIAITQTIHYPLAKTYIQRRIAEGDSRPHVHCADLSRHRRPVCRRSTSRRSDPTWLRHP
jgi:transposase